MKFRDKAQMVSELPMVPEILDLCGVEKKGKKWLCPFHEETEASLGTFKNDTMFGCFGCGKKGSAADLVMHFYDVDYKKAVEMLYAGLKHPAWTEEMLDKIMLREQERKENHNELACKVLYDVAIDRGYRIRVDHPDLWDDVERVMERADGYLYRAQDTAPDVPPTCYFGLGSAIFSAVSMFNRLNIPKG